MTDIIRFYEEGEHKYIETHWNALDGIPYANTWDNDGNIKDGILLAQDKQKYDKYIKTQGVVLISPEGNSFLLTVSNNGDIKAMPYSTEGVE